MSTTSEASPQAPFGKLYLDTVRRINHQKPPRRVLLLYPVIFASANGRTGRTQPISGKQLAKISTIPANHQSAAISWLERTGELQVERRRNGDGKYVASVFVVTSIANAGHYPENDAPDSENRVTAAPPPLPGFEHSHYPVLGPAITRRPESYTEEDIQKRLSESGERECRALARGTSLDENLESVAKEDSAFAESEPDVREYAKSLARTLPHRTAEEWLWLVQRERARDKVRDDEELEQFYEIWGPRACEDDEPEHRRTGPTPMTEDWQPAAGSIAAATQIHPDIDVEYEVEKFRDHYLANGQERADWNACFRKWCTNFAKFEYN